MLVFLFFIIINIFILILTILSTLKIEINELKVSNINNKTNQIDRLTISFYLLNKIRWLNINIKEKKIKDAYQNIEKSKLFNFKKIRQQNINFRELKKIKKLKINLDYFKFTALIGTEDIILTSFLVAILSAFIANNILSPLIKNYEKNKYCYRVVPLYENKNLYEIELNCIISVKMVHIINMIVDIFKKRREKEYVRRASHRRTYGYSYE